MAVADLDGDQISDLVVCNISSGNVALLLGRGDGTFGEAGFWATGRTSMSVEIGDVNGDQLADLAIANSGGGSVALLLGAGEAAFATATAYEMEEARSNG